MTPDERAQHFVTAECDHRTIMAVWLPAVQVEILIAAVLKIGCVLWDVDVVGVLLAVHGSHVPELGRLVFGIAQDIAPVALAVDVGEAFSMAEENAGFAATAQASTVPQLDGRVIGSRVKNVRRVGVSVANSVDVIAVTLNSQHGLLGLNVVHVDGVVPGPGDDLSSIARKTQRPDLVR